MKLSDTEILETEETASGVILGLGQDGHLVRLEFLNAKHFFSPKAIQQFKKVAGGSARSQSSGSV
jgi:hypothetical protein